ncbi:MAG TPA: YciI family protein [Parafilimonas sp.]|nr:YciI family protein [Parafilimonas sp.]
MKPTAVILFSLLFFSNQLSAQQSHAAYDSILAKKLNADDYGMKQYVLVLLKKGPADITDKKALDSIFHGHMANIKRLAAENKLVLAGPTGDNDQNYEGIFVFNTGNVEEAKQWLSTDPAIQSKDLDAEVYAWYGTAALQEIPALHEKIQKKSF